MKTNHPFHSRSQNQRRRGGTGMSETWMCDNPDCKKVYHYSPFCPNATYDVEGIMSIVCYRIGRFLCSPVVVDHARALIGPISFILFAIVALYLAIKS